MSESERGGEKTKEERRVNRQSEKVKRLLPYDPMRLWPSGQETMSWGCYWCDLLDFWERAICFVCVNCVSLVEDTFVLCLYIRCNYQFLRRPTLSAEYVLEMYVFWKPQMGWNISSDCSFTFLCVFFFQFYVSTMFCLWSSQVLGTNTSQCLIKIIILHLQM